MFLPAKTQTHARGLVAMLLLPVLLLAACAGDAPATKQPGRDFSQVDGLVTQMMQLYDIPGVALGLVQNGQVVYSKGYGVRDRRTGAPVTERTLFGIGSISKSFTALGVLQQVDAGTLALDAPVIRYLPDFKLSDPQATQQLTLRHLLSHTSGVGYFDDWYATPARDRKQLVDDMATQPLAAAPGKLYQYTNQNFVVAAHALEQVTGQSWEQYTRAHIFDPLGMHTANFSVDEVQQASDYAAPHELDVLRGIQQVPFFTHYGPAAPASGINASLLDMEQYAIFQLSNGTYQGKTIVSAQGMAEMHKPYIAIPGFGGADGAGTRPAAQGTGTPDAALPTNLAYGLGWINEQYRGTTLVAHNGSIDGFYSYLTLAPSTGAGVILLTNAGYPGGVAAFADVVRLRMVDGLLGLPPNAGLVAAASRANSFDPATWQANLQAARRYQADPADLARLAGDYQGVQGATTVSSHDGRLYVQTAGQALVYELVPFQPSAFLINTGALAGSVLTFKPSPDGTITVYQGAQQIAARRGGGAAQKYTDPQGRFTVDVPPGLAVQQGPTYATLTSTDPPGTFYLPAPATEEDSMNATVKKVLTAVDQSFDREPVDVRDVPLPQGRTWKQYLYQLPDNRLAAVLVTEQAGTAYVLLVRCREADAPALTPIFNDLLASYQITASGANR